jgi:hypothetical protein
MSLVNFLAVRADEILSWFFNCVIFFVSTFDHSLLFSSSCFVLFHGLFFIHHVLYFSRPQLSIMTSSVLSELRLANVRKMFTAFSTIPHPYNVLRFLFVRLAVFQLVTFDLALRDHLFLADEACRFTHR